MMGQNPKTMYPPGEGCVLSEFNVGDGGINVVQFLSALDCSKFSSNS